MRLRREIILGYLLPVVLLMAVMFGLSSMNNIQTHTAVPDNTLKNIAHASEYLILTLITHRFFKKTQARTSVIATIIVVALFAVSDEIHQSFVPTRTSSIGDLLMDYTGLVLGLILSGMIFRKSHEF